MTTDTLTASDINKMSKADLIELLEDEEIELPAKQTVANLRKTAIAELIVEENEDDEEEDDLELDDLEEDEPEAPKAKAKAKKAAKPKAPKIEFGAREASEYISGETGKNYDPRQLRVLLRKMAKDGTISRDPETDARSRYSWSGPDDAEIQVILAAVKDGEIEKASKASLDALKESKAKNKKVKAKAKVEDDDDEELEDLDEDELEDLD